MSAPLLLPHKQDDYGSLQQDTRQHDTLLKHENESPASTTSTSSDAKKPQPSQASFASRMLFAFVQPLMRVGNERQLSEKDMWELEGDDRTAAAFAKYNLQYQRHSKSVARAIWSTYASSFFLCGLGAAFTAGCNLLSPAVLNYVINAFSAPELDTTSLATWLGAFFLSRIANVIVSTQSNFAVELIALRVTVALKSLLFQKAMRRSIQSKNATTADDKAVDIANLFTSDVDNILYAAFQVNNIWVLPLQIGVIIYMLYNVIGAAAFAGLGVICASMLTSFFVVKVSSKAFGDIMTRKDDRMKVIKEVFGAIQIVKLNAWEEKFADKIGKLRVLELQAIARFLYMVAAELFILWTTPVLVSAISFAVYTVAMGQVLTAAKVFTAIALFNALRNPLTDLPNVIQQLIQAKISIGRMSEYLALDEYNPSSVTREDPSQPEDVIVAIDNGSFGWTKDTPLLKDVSLKVKRGDLVVVHGSVGAGKSSLCSALLGEMETISGSSVFVRGSSVAYYSQQTWIQNMTIRDNILFGNAYEPQRYQKVLDACGLLPDLAQLPGGDATEIGEKGVNLSGGQKARLCLARACYSDADLFILDSPLAAVDAVVQSEIFGKCICGLLESKTIVLVTHSPDIIASEAANYKILVQDGTLSGKRQDASQPRRFYATSRLPHTPEDDMNHQIETEESAKANADAGRLVDDEEREEGRVSKDVFLRYFNSLGGIRVCVLFFLVQTLWQGFGIGSDLWLSHWTSQNLGEHDQEQTAYNMKVYALLGAGSAAMVLARTLMVAFFGLKAARHLFDSMTHSLLNVPLRFFDANPIGRIVNRFGDDMASVDFSLANAYGWFLATLFLTVFQLAAAVYMVNFLGLLIVPLLYVYVQVARFYLAPSREVSRLWKVAGSPVLSHLTQSEAGVEVIRAFGPDYVDRMVAENFRAIDLCNVVWYAETAIGQWFQVRMQLIGTGVVIVIVSGLVYLRHFLSPGLVGLVFTYALSVDAGLATLIRSWLWVELNMVAPERILEYANIPAEGSEKLLVIEPPAQWPHSGSIQFQDVVFSYKEGAPAVLKHISFDIKSNEKIGIVGRTGAGKSSLTMALFRINELDAGRILIDGEDISSMPLRALRSRLSIIPQAPVLFKGTLRAYMDPFEEFSDAAIWSAFEKVEMKEQIGALEHQLLYELSENGENFSVGERQLFCMARALLTQTRIVVMDEATASIDHATEQKLQTMIARDFESATVLTIAHRLATVLDSDRIMVLSDGEVVEFDTPRNLVRDPNGAFYRLAKEGGCLDQLLQ